MKISVPKISSQVYNQDIHHVLEKNYSVLGPIWTSHQLEWTNSIYASFRDHNKFLIIIYLIKKTLDFYARNFIKLSFSEFYSQDKVEIEKFNVIELSRNLNIPKESARRKILELEQIDIIKKIKKKIIIDRSAFPFTKPTNSVKRVSRFLAMFSEILVKDKILRKPLNSSILEKVIENNFTYAWKMYYELQIPMLLGYKKIFGEIENFHIFASCVINQHLHSQRFNKNPMNWTEFTKIMYSNNKILGINAMSISDITGIPRSTVVRKLKYLVKKEMLKIDDKKHYKLTGIFVKKLMPVQNIVLHRLADFSTKIYNLAII